MNIAHNFKLKKIQQNILNLMTFLVTIYVFKVAQVLLSEGDTSLSYGNYWWANTIFGVFLLLSIPQTWKSISNGWFSVILRTKSKIKQKLSDKFRNAIVQTLSILSMVIFLNVITVVKLNHVLNFAFFDTVNIDFLFISNNYENIYLKRIFLTFENRSGDTRTSEFMGGLTTMQIVEDYTGVCAHNYYKHKITTAPVLAWWLLENTNDNLYFFKDGLSLWLLWLVSLIFFVISFGSSKKLKHKNVIFLNFYVYEHIIYLILILIAVCFSVKNILIFFISFEMILIPLFLHMIFQGSRLNKIEAVKYLVTYTLVGSIFLWYALSYFIEILGTSNFDQLQWLVSSTMSVGSRKIIFISLFLGFAFKIPLVPFHHWLVIAHVEAPTSGSIVLAALLLKVGGYGMYRFVFTLFPLECFYFSNIIFGIAIFGYTYATLLAIRQVDLKRYVAYTSIAHMNFSLLGLFSMFDAGILGFVHMMISHGIIASALFYIVGHVYSIISFRDSVRISGLAYTLPKVSFFFFLFSLANMGLPLFSGFPGEFFILVAVVMKNVYFGLFIFFGFIFSGVYNFLQINKILFSTNSLNAKLGGRNDLDSKSILVLGVLLYWSVVLGLIPDIVTQNIEVYI